MMVKVSEHPALTLLKGSSGPSSSALLALGLWVCLPVFPPPFCTSSLQGWVSAPHHCECLLFVWAPALTNSTTFPQGEAWVQLVSPALAEESRDQEDPEQQIVPGVSAELSNPLCCSLPEIYLLSVREADRALLKVQTLEHRQMWVCVLTPLLISHVALSKWPHLCFLINTGGVIQYDLPSYTYLHVVPTDFQGGDEEQELAEGLHIMSTQ